MSYRESPPEPSTIGRDFEFEHQATRDRMRALALSYSQEELVHQINRRSGRPIAQGYWITLARLRLGTGGSWLAFVHEQLEISPTTERDRREVFRRWVLSTGPDFENLKIPDDLPEG